MISPEPLAVRQFRSRVGSLLFLKYSVAALTVWAFVFGVVVLALRAALGTPWQTLIWGCATAPFALIVAFVLARKRVPEANSVLALFDQREQCGGLLMSGAEQSIQDWQSVIPRLNQPALGWRFQIPSALFGVALAFLIAAFAIPQGWAEFSSNALDITREKELLAAQIEVLDKEKVIEAPRADAMKKTLEELEKDARGKDPVKTLESLDHLRKEVEKAAREALEAAIKKEENLAKAEKLASSIENAAPKLDQQQMNEAMQLLAAIAKKSASEDEMLENGLDEETLEALKDGSLSPDQLEKLGEALEGAKGGSKKKLGKLVKVKLLKSDDLSECEGACECDCEALEAFLKECGCKASLAAALCEMPGRGGLNEGPGAAKLTFGDEASKEGAKFKEVQLSQGNLDSLKKSQLSGLSKGQPQEKGDKPSATQTGALNQAATGGGAANTQPILPKHKGVVDRFFDRPAAKK